MVPASTEPHQQTSQLNAVLVVLIRPCTEQDQLRYDQLQELRRQHDHSFDRWLPHMTLIPPFTLPEPARSHTAALDSLSETTLEALVARHEDELSQLVGLATEVCNRHASHQLRLDQVSTFPLRQYTNVHIRPYPTNFQDKRTRPLSSRPASTSSDADLSSRRVVDLQQGLSDAITPWLRSEGGRNKRNNVFKPHVSVGQSTSPKATWQLCTAAENMLGLREARATGPQTAGLLCNIDRVQLMIKPKGADGPYHVYKELSLNTEIKR